MSNPFKCFDELAARARQEAAPSVNATAGVISRLQQVEEPSNVPLEVFAAGALALALVAALTAAQLFGLINDPLSDLFQAAIIVW